VGMAFGVLLSIGELKAFVSCRNLGERKGGTLLTPLCGGGVGWRASGRRGKKNLNVFGGGGGHQRGRIWGGVKGETGFGWGIGQVSFRRAEWRAEKRAKRPKEDTGFGECCKKMF